MLALETNELAVLVLSTQYLVQRLAKGGDTVAQGMLVQIRDDDDGLAEALLKKVGFPHNEAATKMLLEAYDKMLAELKLRGFYD
jgi:hypothetical protein